MATKPLTVHGSDVSHHQGTLDLARAKKAGLQFLYHKATEGDSFTDPEYDIRRKHARAAGIPFGAYHFARPEVGDAVAEARRFIAVAKPVPGDLVPALDLETTEGLSQAQLKTWAKTFSNEVKRLTGVVPVLYCPWNLGLVNTRWVPRYNNSNTPPTVPWDIFQFSNGVYGVPNEFPGLGHVDLNHFRDGFGVKRIQIAKPSVPVEPEKPLVLDLMHASMQYSDNDAQMASDSDKIFARAAKRGVPWITGTEAGADDLRKHLQKAAEEHGYRVFFGNRNDSWVAVSKDVQKGKAEVDYTPVIFTGDGVGHHGPRGVLAVTFDTKVPGLGRVTVLATHYLTKGRPVKNATYSANIEYNEILAREVGRLSRKYGKGSALVFFGGDQNIVDRDHDTFLGLTDMTSSWDELEKYENTGHGNIDVIASYDKDGRVVAAYCRALDDKEFALHTDHFLVESGFEVKRLKAA
jgi:GH25 family lysozyme M1 (1,4-beta-N-acetylmuramidase)